MLLFVFVPTGCVCHDVVVIGSCHPLYFHHSIKLMIGRGKCKNSQASCSWLTSCYYEKAGISFILFNDVDLSSTFWYIGCFKCSDEPPSESWNSCMLPVCLLTLNSRLHICIYGIIFLEENNPIDVPYCIYHMIDKLLPLPLQFERFVFHWPLHAEEDIAPLKSDGWEVSLEYSRVLRISTMLLSESCRKRTHYQLHWEHQKDGVLLTGQVLSLPG